MKPLRSLARVIAICGLELGAAVALCFVASILLGIAIHTTHLFGPPVMQPLDVRYAHCQRGLVAAVPATASGSAFRIVGERADLEQELLIVSLEVRATLGIPIPSELRGAAAARGCELRDYQLGAAAVPWGRIAFGALLLFQAALAFVLFVRWRSRAPLHGLASAGGRVMALAVVAGIALAGAALAVATVILPESRTPQLLELLLQQPYGRLALSVVAIGVAPVIEELFFRRLLLQRFLAAGWPIAGVLLTSVAFANLHLWQASDLAKAVYAWTATLIGSLLLSAVYLRTRSWRVSAAMHAAYNGTLVLPLWI